MVHPPRDDHTYDYATGTWRLPEARYQALLRNDPEYPLLDDLFLWIDDPERGWPILLRLIAELDEDDPALFDMIGAGPVEELVVHHADAFIDRIEAQARADSRFRSCLSYIWLSKGHVSEDLERRLLEATHGAILILDLASDRDEDGSGSTLNPIP